MYKVYGTTEFPFFSPSETEFQIFWNGKRSFFLNEKSVSLQNIFAGSWIRVVAIQPVQNMHKNSYLYFREFLNLLLPILAPNPWIFLLLQFTDMYEFLRTLDINVRIVFTCISLNSPPPNSNASNTTYSICYHANYYMTYMFLIILAVMVCYLEDFNLWKLCAASSLI